MNIEDQINKSHFSPYKKALLKDIYSTEMRFQAKDIVTADNAYENIMINTPAIPDISDKWYSECVSDIYSGRVPKKISVVLTKEQEEALFLQWNFAKSQVEAYKTYGFDSSWANDLIGWYELSMELRRRLVAVNLALVLSLVRKYSKSQIDSESLLSDGNFYLLKALEGFNPTKNIKFSTYCTTAVKNAFNKSIERENKKNDFMGVSLDPVIENTVIDEKAQKEKNYPLFLMKLIIKKNLAELSDTELAIIKERWFYDDSKVEKQPTLKEVGELLNKRKSNVGRIEMIAREKLGKKLEELLEIF